MLLTGRLVLKKWAERHREPFAAMHGDPQVMLDQGGPVDRQTSYIKFDRYRRAFDEHGLSRWAVETQDGSFVGYTGVMHQLSPDHPLGPHAEIGWRFIRAAWGVGFATESSKAALRHAFHETNLNEIVSYTFRENHRSQAVMRRLDLRRDPSRDFTARHPNFGAWRGLVWVAERSAFELSERGEADINR